ncbi:hypothetical protein [Lapidilactobacillus bayanensis]|uniref:hypothetical protein n=1 Tax=Lapidilactobacillus bayanensis TaxID=2485998 RepID=UPI000F7A38A8|nr:hypothetical protein [Lapidilactobacillus bayanensis]
MDTMLDWLFKNFDYNSILIVILIVIVLFWIKKSPEMFMSKEHDYRTSDAAQRLQIDQYYRQDNGGDIKKNLEWWTEFLVDPEAKAKELSNDDGETNDQQVKKLNDRMQFIMQYGSARTVKLLSIYMYKNYRGDINDNGTLVCVAYIVASLKSDYTGQDTMPMDLLKIKFNDFSKNESKYRKICKTIKKETGIDDHLKYRRLK